MAYEDEPLHLEKPAGVSDDAWEARLDDYAAAFALYRRVVARVGAETLAGLRPTDDQLRAEDRAEELLTTARSALLDLCRVPR